MELDRTAAMEIKILAMDVEKKYWQYSILSLIKQLQSPSSGICSHGVTYVHVLICICNPNRGSIDAVLQACNETTAVEHPVH